MLLVETFLKEHDYTLLKELGQGGYATVYKVRHNKYGYVRALKVPNAAIANEQDEKFLEECRLLLKLGNGNHPNIVHIHQLWEEDHRAIVEMDFVDGKNLSEYIEDKSSFVEIEDVLKLLTDIGSALAYCHEDIYKFCMNIEDDNLETDPNDGSKILLTERKRNELIKKYRVIHNDIHSGNIICREDGNFILLDFGLAVNENNRSRLSRKKNGVPEFKAPEKWDNDGILTTQSDIYSFGVVLYEFIAGRVPFVFDKNNSNTAQAEYFLSQAHKDKLPEPIYDLRKKVFEKTHPGEKYEKDYPDWLERLIMKCLAKKPADRFRNGKELYEYVRKQLKATDSCSFCSTISKLKKENDDLRNIVDKERVRKGNVDEFVADLQKQLMESGKVREKLNAEVISLQQKNMELKESMGILSEYQDSYNKQAQQIQRLQDQLTASRKNSDTVSHELFLANKNIDSLKKENRRLKLQGNPKGSKSWKAVTLIFGIILMTACAGVVGVYYNLDNNDAVGIPVGDRNLYISFNDGIKDTLSISSERDSLEREMAELRNNSSSAAKQTSNLKKQIQDKESQIAGLTATIQTLNSEISSLKTTNQGMVSQSAVTERDNTISQLRTRITNLQNSINKKDEEIKKLEKEISVLQKTIFN